MNDRASILVVDDVRNWRDTLTRILEHEGHEVVAVSSFAEAKQAIDSKVFHVAIVDIRLADADPYNVEGLELLSYFSGRESDITNAIVLTGYGTSEIARASLVRFGARDFLEKGRFDVKEFRDIVRRAAEDALAKTSVPFAELAGIWHDIVNSLKTKAHDGFAAETQTLVSRLARSLHSSFTVLELPCSCDSFVAYAFDTQSIFWATRLPSVMPFLFLRRQELTNVDLNSLRYLISGEFKRFGNIAFLFLFLTDAAFASARELLNTRICRPYAHDIIPVNLQSLQHILVARDPREAFRQFVLKQVNIVSISPFIITGSTSDTMFFGRELELREITENAATRSYLLLGGRRIGKTSILKRLERVRMPAAGFRALYHDCAYTPSQVEMVQAVTADKAWFPEQLANPPASLVEVIQSLPDDKPLILLLDEADKLIAPDRALGYPLLNAIRALSNSRQGQFVLVGERAMRSELNNPNSPLYNLARPMLIGHLDFEAVQELVIRSMKQLEIELIDERRVVRLIWNFTSGHPNVVQRLCHQLVVLLNERGDRRLVPDNIETVIADPSFLRRDFLDIYWERATVLERLCSLAMAADDDVRTLTDVHRALFNCSIEPALNEVDDALERLVDLRNILQRTTEGYEFAVTAFPEVVARTARMNDWIALNCETYQLYGDVDPRSKRGNP